MKEQFVNEFISSLSGDFDKDILSVLFKKLTVFVNGYEIKPIETSLELYTNYMPECYQTYFVTRKIEGMSMKSLELYDLYLKDFSDKSISRLKILQPMIFEYIYIKFKHKEDLAIEAWIVEEQLSMHSLSGVVMRSMLIAILVEQSKN